MVSTSKKFNQTSQTNVLAVLPSATSHVKKCSFNNCTSTSLDPTIQFKHFRKKDVDIWIKACKNESLKDIPVGIVLKHRFVCDKHFSFNDFNMILSGFQGRLNSTAIPKDPYDGK